MALDEELINRSNQKNEEADSSESSAPSSDNGGDEGYKPTINEAQRSEAGQPSPPVNNNDIAASKQAKKKAKKKEEDKKKEEEDSPQTPMSQGTGKILKLAWENLVTSWGATLIWIDIHVMANQIFGNKVFCDLGEEWLQANAAKSFGKAAKKSTGLVEKMGCGCLNLGCLLIVLLIACVIALIAGFFDNPFKALAYILGSIWHNLTGG